MKLQKKTEARIYTFLVFLTFLGVSLFTLGDYNVNWDSPIHYIRGQAYLRLLLSGKTDYKDVPWFKNFQQYTISRDFTQEGKFPRYSIYQSEALNGEYFLVNDAGHPPLNGIGASFFNYLFYQKLGLIGDVESYHFFIIVISSLLVALVFYWSFQEFGIFAGLVSALTIATYPLYIAESHNNVKDPVESFFFALAIYYFYKAIRNTSWKLILASAISSGFAFGTKFNIVFLPFILCLWIALVYSFAVFRSPIKILKIPKNIIGGLIVYPLIPFSIVVIFWPYLWADPIARFLKIADYYRGIGTGSGSQPEYLLWGFNTYPWLWILYTTPYITLLFVIIGVILSVFLLRKNKVLLLWIVWMFVPIVRVTLPGSSIYGGVRQIMEYIPPMAMLTGFGAFELRKLIQDRFRKSSIIHYGFILLLGLGYVFAIYQIIKIHPNENLYFNDFIGGLKGAANKNLPGWSTTLGNPYLQGVKWLNSHAEKNAILTLAVGTMTNVPKTFLRRDITFANNLESLTQRKGEYIMGLTYLNLVLPYDAQYPEAYLVPVYEKIVDGVAILKIWKNDEVHTKKGYIHEKKIENIKTTKNDTGFFIVLDSKRFITKVTVVTGTSCPKPDGGFIETSIDGKEWTRETEGILDEQIPNVKKFKDGVITQSLASVPAQFIKVSIFHQPTCGIRDYSVTVVVLSDVVP